MTLDPELPQVGVPSITAFHRTAPEVEQALRAPLLVFTRKAIRRYGFPRACPTNTNRLDIAGIRARRSPNGRVRRGAISAMAARLVQCRTGVSVATTMGFTALDGFANGYPLRRARCRRRAAPHSNRRGCRRKPLVDLLYRRSGMLGLSGISSDFRRALDQRQSACALLPSRCFAIAVARHIALGSRAATRRRLDGIVFTAGCRREWGTGTQRDLAVPCSWLGLELDEGGQPEPQGAH